MISCRNIQIKTKQLIEFEVTESVMSSQRTRKQGKTIFIETFYQL